MPEASQRHQQWWYISNTSCCCCQQVMQLLRSGQAVAMVSDAGLPLVNDPGASLVAEAVSAGIKV